MPGCSSSAEEAGLDPIDAPKPPSANYGALNEELLDPIFCIECSGKLEIELLELIRARIERDDVLYGLAVLEQSSG